MTLTAAPAPVEVEAPSRTPAVARTLPFLAFAAALLWWGSGLVHGGGGRDAGVLAVGLVLLGVALAVVRPWRVLPTWALALAAWVSAAALVVVPVAGVGRAGAVAAGTYVLSAGLAVLVAAWARSRVRMHALAAGVCLAGLVEFGLGFEAWWGGGGSAPGPMVGTFYWWNPYAAYLVAPALLGLALVLAGRRPWRAAGWLATPFAVSGVVFSSSRASLAVLLVGWVVVAALQIASADRPARRARRAGLLTLVCALAPWLLTSPLFFPGGASPLGATVARQSAGQSVALDGGYRLTFWHEAWSAFRQHPVSGTGYGRLLAGYVPKPDVPASPFAHNGLLQAAAEGGLVLAVPTAAALLCAVLVCLLRLRRPARWDGVPAAAAVAALGLLAHGLVDFDWTFPAVAGSLGMLVGMAGARPASTSPARGGRLAVTAGVALVALIVLAGALAWGQGFHISNVSLSRYLGVGP
ncbi:MAG TPA: O-antigen ligase family protein [Actinomycetes bacterium]|nr:O-antigen ligase family protein [Actinomycetes bacterium]